jgi:membrane-associated phospholipid phosphatase
LVSLAIASLFDAPQILVCLSAFSIIQLGVLGLINGFWKISIHATSIAAAAVIVALVYGLGYGLLLLPLVIAVTWLRLYLRRHTVAQVTAGLTLGVVAPLLMTRFGCFL